MRSVCIALCAVLALLPLVAAQVPIPYYNCASAGAHVKIVNATVTEWPIVAGQRAEISIQAVLDESVSGGQYSVQASFDGFPVINQQGSLSQFNVSWPIPAGEFNFSKSVKIPSLLAGSTIVVNASATDQNGQELACIGIEIQAVSPSDAKVLPAIESVEVEEEESLFVPKKQPSLKAAMASLFEQAGQVLERMGQRMMQDEIGM